MTIAQKPRLNGRILAEFYLSSETAKRSILRAYAKPQEQQQARVIMYDPVRRIVPEYFSGGRDEAVLHRAADLLVKKHFGNPDFDERWHRANRRALENLLNVRLNGEFKNVTTHRVSVRIRDLDVLSTADFYATFVPNGSKSVPKLVAVVINPSGVKKPSFEQRRLWARIENEVAWRAADANRISVTDVIYLDLAKSELHKSTGPRARIWSEIDATCERILRDWREIRSEEAAGEQHVG